MSFQDYSRIFKSSLLSVQLHGAGLPCDHVASSSEDEMNLNAQNAISKKRRLSVQQVRCLETSFEEESKLEPERKMQLAADLGLQPRQVAVWFQNRRARWKTKQLERDFDKLKQNYEALLSEKNELEHQVAKLKQGLQNLQSHKREDYQNSTSLVTDKIEAKLENVQKTTTAPSDEFHSMSPGFSSEADSNVERTLSSGSADGPYQYDDKQLHSLCADAPYLSNFNMFDYLIMEHHETDWLAAFH